MPPSLEKGMISSGSSMTANCFIIGGKAKNTSDKTLYDADVYGRIYDADNNNVMENRTRLGSIEEVPQVSLILKSEFLYPQIYLLH